MIVSRRFVLLASSISAALILSACQPKTEDNDAKSSEAASPTVTDIADSQNDVEANDELLESDDLADESQMTDMLKDYTKSMTRMHDEMMIGMGYNDPDTAFAKSMLGHHRGALELAKIQLKYGSDETMRHLAQDIITAQQLEINILNKWLASHPDAPKPKPNTEAMQQAYERSMDVLNANMVLGIADPIPDMAFARGMLPHHISAVKMANIQLKYGTDEEMRQLAQDIIDTQQAEIERMEDWIEHFKANKIADKGIEDGSIEDESDENEADNQSPELAS